MAAAIRPKHDCFRKDTDRTPNLRTFEPSGYPNLCRMRDFIRPNLRTCAPAMPIRVGKTKGEEDMGRLERSAANWPLARSNYADIHPNFWGKIRD